MNAAAIIDAAFLASLQEFRPNAFANGEYSVGQWAEGEAEDWLRQIADGNVTLGMDYDYITNTYHPCLRD